MGDRFYQQQTGKTVGCLPSVGATKMTNGAKPKRKLKAEWVTDIEHILECQPCLLGLLKTDLKTLETLYKAIKYVKDI